MKSVLISIQPKWCELIASGEKTIEVQKTRPKSETPFKCYIYETKSKYKKCTGIFAYGIELKGTAQGSGKVIGEFVCDKIDIVRDEGYGEIGFVAGGVEEDKWTSYAKGLIKKSCVPLNELKSYLKYDYGYFMHISNLKIYDKPKELGDFVKPCDQGDKSCYLCDKSGYSPDMILQCYNTPTRPPMSFCYVEE